MLRGHAVPAHRAAHLRVVAALHRDLGAVVQVHRSRQRELKHLREAARLDIGHGCGQAKGVVVVEIDPAFEQVFKVGVAHHACDHARERGAVELAVGGGNHQLAQPEVHHAIDRWKPFARIVRNLAHHQRAGLLGVRGLRQLTEVVEADVEGHVQAPTVDAVAQIAAHDRVLCGVDMVPHGLVLEVQFGQVLGVPPGSRATLVLRSECEPLSVGALRVGLGLPKDWRIAAHVVEHAVEDQLQVAAFEFRSQLLHVLAGAEFGRDGVVVERIVFVIGPAEVNRTEVQHIDAELLHVVEPTRRAGEIAAPEVDLVAPDAGALKVGAALGLLGPGAQLLWRGIQRALGIEVGTRREAIDQHLVDKRAVAPVGLAFCVHAGNLLVVAVGVVHGARGLRPGARAQSSRSRGHGDQEQVHRSSLSRHRRSGPRRSIVVQAETPA